MKILITICARGGSKGIIGKNTKIIREKHLIGYTIEAAKKFQDKYKAKISISTDSQIIIDIAKLYGVSTDYLRPSHLATDIAGKIDTIRDLILYEEKLINSKYDFILDLDVTSPLRSLSDLESAYNLIKNDTDAINIFSVNNANRNPYFNMVEKNQEGYFSLVKAGKDVNVMTRQTAPNVYDLNASFYFYKRNFFDSNCNSAITDKSLIYIMNHICFDLDHEIDFLFMDFLLTNNKLDFDL